MNKLNDIECGQLCQTTIQCLNDVHGSLSSFPALLKKIIRNKAWERRVFYGQTIQLHNLRELVTEKPIRGWGEDPKKIEAVIRDDPEALAMYREAMNVTLGEHRRPSKEESNSKPCDARNSEYGTNSYWQARIQRDCPDELAAIKAGEKTIMDVRRERGWVSSSRRVTLPDDPERAAEVLRKKFGCDYIKQLKGLL